MKKVNFKSMIAMLSFALAMLFVGVEQLSAQTNVVDAPLAVPQGNFVSNDEAQAILAVELAGLKDQLTSLQVGDPVYAAVEMQYVYYGGIDNALKSGSTVPEAIVEGLAPFTTDAYAVDAATINLLKQGAIQLLSN